MNPFFPNRAERLLARLAPEPVAIQPRRPTATAVLIEGTAAGRKPDRASGTFARPAGAARAAGEEWPREATEIAPFPSAAMIAEENRARVSADLTGPGLTICLWLAVAALLGVAAMHFIHQLAVLDASLACAARV